LNKDSLIDSFQQAQPKLTKDHLITPIGSILGSKDLQGRITSFLYFGAATEYTDATYNWQKQSSIQIYFYI